MSDAMECRCCGGRSLVEVVNPGMSPLCESYVAREDLNSMEPFFDVEELWTHGGSLRIYACHADSAAHPTRSSVDAMRRHEKEAGLDRVDTYIGFAKQVQATKRRLLGFLIEAKDRGQSIVGYGAPGKGNTLLNYRGMPWNLKDGIVQQLGYIRDCGGRFVVPIPKLLAI